MRSGFRSRSTCAPARLGNKAEISIFWRYTTEEYGTTTTRASCYQNLETILNEDFLDLLSALLAANVRFLVVGAYAVGVHGHPRATKDLDILVEASAENAKRVLDAMRSFGAPLGDLVPSDLEKPGTGFKMGMAPRRIDILTQVSGVTFEEAWDSRIEAGFGKTVRCFVIGLDALVANKRAAGRPQDLADVDVLERIRGARKA